MSGQSPASVLYSSDGYELAVVGGDALILGTRSILVAGSDGTNTQTILTDINGQQIVVGAGTAGSPSGGVITVQGDPSGTPIPITGSISATNPSVSITGDNVPADATFVGGKVNTSSPSYTDGYIEALSLTTAGALRIDGSAVTQPVSGTVTANAGTGTFTVGGTVTADAGSGTFTVGGTVTADAGSGTFTVGGTVTSDQGAAAALSGAWPVEITDGTNVLGTTANPVVISGSVTTNKAATSSVTSVAGATSNTQILASNSNRVFASIYNGTNKNMYVKLGTTASTSSYSILLITGSYWEVPTDWTGEIDAVWANGVNGNALITELTP